MFIIGFRYNRRIKIAPGIHLHLGKKGHSWSFDKRGLGTINDNYRTKKGKKNVDTGIKGLYWTEQSSAKAKTRQQQQQSGSKRTTIFGLIVGEIEFIVLMLFFIWIIAMFKFSTSNRCYGNLKKEIGI